MPCSRSLSIRARSHLAAWLLALAAPWTPPAAVAQVEGPRDVGLGLKLTLQAADFPIHPSPADAYRIDLTLHWDGIPTPAGPISLFAGRPLAFGRRGTGLPGMVAPDPELRSASDLVYVGMQFDSGARLRLKRSGDGLKLSYRASF